MNLSSKIVAVTVYREGALVIRKAEVRGFNSFSEDGREGSSVLVLGPVPLCIDDSSVKVWSDSDKAPRFSSFNVCLDLAKTGETPLKDLENELKAASSELDNLVAKKDVLSTSLSAIENCLSINERGEGKEGEPPAKISFDVRKSLVHFKTAQKSRIVAAIAACGREIVDSRKIKADVEDRIKRASKSRAAREEELSKIVVVQTETNGLDDVEDSFSINFSYYVPGARWVPSYALCFANDYSSVDLSMKAALAQNTKEDWTGVKIALSTASYMGYSELPELKSMLIGHSQTPPPSVGWRPLPGGLNELYGDYDKAFGKISGSLNGSARPRPALLDNGLFDSVMAEVNECKDQIRDCLMSTENMDCFAGAPPAPPECEPAPMVQRTPSPKAKMAKKMSTMRSDERQRSAAPPSMAAMSTGRPGAFTASGGAANFTEGGRCKSLCAPVPYSAPASVSADDYSVSSDFLDYGNLEMAAPDNPSRGKLVPSDALSRYLTSPAARESLEGVNFVRAINASMKLAGSPLRLPMPLNSSIPSVYNDFVYLYEGTALVDVPSDGSFHTVSILLLKANTMLKYVSVPRMTEDVFRVALFKNSLSMPLPKGPCDVSVGSGFLLRTTLDTVAPDGNVELGLGVEQAIKIIRNTSFTENEEGIIRSEFNLRHRLDIEIRNGLPSEISIQVRERIPYVPDKANNVAVSLEEIEPPWEDYKQEASPITGGHCWNVKVGASEKKKLTATYNVEIPSSYELVGGNRREA